MQSKASLTLLLLLAACVPQNLAANSYRTHFSAEFSAEQAIATATVIVEQKTHILRELNMRADPERYAVVKYDGKVSHSDGRLLWQIPHTGGRLTYTVKIDSPRGDAFDARHTSTWTLLRLDDLFPAARARTLKDAASESTLTISGPANWSFESPYGDVGRVTKTLPVTRNYNRPKGWLLGGEIGTRRTTIGDRKIAISAPKGIGFGRLEAIAFLQWTLPEFVEVFSDLPSQVLVVGAPHVMWRGGLSAPGSIFLHVDRPLISENATSTPLHELAHIAGLTNAAAGADWIVEGLAEYYSLLILRRTGGISEQRFTDTLADLKDWSDREHGKLTDPSSGANTASAVLHLHQLAGRLERAGSSIDELVRRLLRAPRISIEAFESISTQLLDDSA
jgi:hypothetical protein